MEQPATPARLWSEKNMSIKEVEVATASGDYRTRRWAILATMLLGTTLAILDSSILNILVVPIIEEFRTDLRTVEWILTSYNLAFAVFMIGFGSLGDRAGRRRLYVFGQVIFVVGSGLAAVASGPWQIIAFRAIQGLGAAALAPNALAIILDHFPEGERGAALGVWGAAAGLGGALGPTVGGLVAQEWGWRALFLVNIPVGLLVAGTAYRLLAPDRQRYQQPFDSRGFFTLSAALLAFSVSLMGVPGAGGTWVKSGFVALALLLGMCFILVERRAPEPLVDLKAILRREVIAANLAVFVALLIMAGGMFLSVLYAQLLTDASQAAIGLLLAPCALMTFVLAPVGGRLADKIGPRVLAVAGLLALTASVAIPAQWHPGSATSVVLWSNLIAGAGIGLATPALIRVATESVGQDRAGMGAGVYKTVNELGGVFGVILLGTVLEGRIIANALQQIPGHFLPQELSVKAVTSLKALESHALQKGLPVQDLDGFHRALVEAIQRGFEQVFGLAVLLAGIGVAAALMVPKRLNNGPDEMTVQEATTKLRDEKSVA
jgi:EmrB/QacA subfamily drug resistance transporter